MPVYYGDINVTILNDSHYPDWSVTEFIMSRVSNYTSLMRVLILYYNA